MSDRWSIFAEPWWLEAVAPGAWGEVTLNRHGKLAARLPYVTTKRFGLKFMDMPPLTQHLGPWIAPAEGKYLTRLAREHELMAALIDELPDFDLFLQQFHYHVSNWLPFYWKGYSQTTRYTYVLTDLSDIDAIFRNLRGQTRNHIRKAEKAVQVVEGYDVDTLMRLSAATFERQSEAVPFDKRLVQRIVDACRARDCCRILVAIDSASQAHSAVLLVWDQEAAYYLIGGSDLALSARGANSLLIWHAIRLASQVSKTFDFEGSMIQPVEQFFRSFGARQQPYHRVTKANSRLIAAGMALAGEQSRRIGRRLMRRS